MGVNFKYPVRLHWTIKNQYPYFSKVTDWVIERYGSPGKYYVTQVDIDFMDFIFKKEEDAVYFSLIWL